VIVEPNITFNNRILRTGIAVPLCIILYCSHLLLGPGYYAFVLLSTALIITGMIGWCPVTWLIRKIKEIKPQS
jgi:hypothetical protein